MSNRLSKQLFPSLSSLRLPIALALLASILLLGGCGPVDGTIDSETPGFFNHYLIYPLSSFIQAIAALLHDNYGAAVIAITLIIRIVLFPLMLRQARSSQKMKLKMAAMKPELDQLQDKYKDKNDADAMQKKQQEMLALYQKHQFNPLAIGCLPMLIQLPILTGLYYAIRMTPEVASHSFLWFKLGESDVWLPIIAALVYFVQFKVSQKGMQTEGQPPQLALLGYLSPILMGVFALTAPAAISLYWVTGGLFMIAQSYLLLRLYPAPSAAKPSESPPLAETR